MAKQKKPRVKHKSGLIEATRATAETRLSPEGHREFLDMVARSVHELVQHRSNRRWFQEQLSAFWKLRDEFALALTKAQLAAMVDPKFRYSYDDTRDKDKDPPLPPVEGYEVERYHVLDTPPKGFWRPLLPFNPDAWLSRFQCQWAGLVHPPAEEPRDKAQMLMCEYALLATIHDEALNIPACDRLTDSSQDDWVESVWEDVSHEGTTMDDVATLWERQSYVETALSDVKTDLAERATEAGQESGGSQNEDDVPTLREDEVEVLNYLNEEYPQIRFQQDIASARDVDRKTAKTILDRLMVCGLVSRPEGRQKGYVITTQGREYLEKYFGA